MTTDPASGAADRDELLARVDERTYDVVIVGGGIAGAGIARDAAFRGLETLLLEQNDFASGTTAWSTRLIHGGLRYLEQYDFGLVFESLQERETLAEIAPHLVDPLTFAIPQYDEPLSERIKLRLGMILYDLLSYNKTMPRHERLSSAELAATEPALPESGLQGGFLYHDRQCEFVERLCLENVLDAAANGADVLNHAEATGIRTANGEVTGVTVRDRLEGEEFDADGRTVVNAAGPWADRVLGTDGRLVRPAKGIHIVVPSVTEYAVTLPTTDGRVVFVVPWNGKSLIGTTDTDFEGDPADATATRADVEYLLEEVGRYLPGIGMDDVMYTYAGVRPLYNSGGAGDSAAVSRAHKVVDHGDPAGLFSLIGAKITPYRQAAEELTDALAEHLTTAGGCRTDAVPLPGARGEATRDADLPASVLAHLEGLYGTRTDAVLERIDHDGRLAEPLCAHTDDVLAQVTVAVEEEFARRLTDVVFRRCTVGYETCEARDAVDTVATHMGDLLGWDEDRRRRELERYEAVIERRHGFAT